VGNLFAFSWLGKSVFLTQAEDSNSDYLKLHREEALDQVLQLFNAQKPFSSCSSVARSERLRQQRCMTHVRVSLVGGFCPLMILKCICSMKGTLQDTASFPFPKSYGDER